MTQTVELARLIRERAVRSNLYKRLDPNRRIKFEQAVEAYSNQVLTGASMRDIKHEWRQAALASGAEDLLDQMKTELATAFGVKEGSFNSAIRNTARDVLHVIADPKAHATIKDLLTIRKHAQKMSAHEIVPGRQLSTRETQPPSTGARTLRRRK
jgi:hypothetical protein